jgi:hypothetical protein
MTSDLNIPAVTQVCTLSVIKRRVFQSLILVRGRKILMLSRHVSSVDPHSLRHIRQLPTLPNITKCKKRTFWRTMTALDTTLTV